MAGFFHANWMRAWMRLQRNEPMSPRMYRGTWNYIRPLPRRFNPLNCPPHYTKQPTDCNYLSYGLGLSGRKLRRVSMRRILLDDTDLTH